MAGLRLSIIQDQPTYPPAKLGLNEGVKMILILEGSAANLICKLRLMIMGRKKGHKMYNSITDKFLGM